MKTKKVFAGILLISGLILGVKGVRDITFESDVNMSTQWIFGSPSEGQLSFARRGQTYQEKRIILILKIEPDYRLRGASIKYSLV